MTDVSPTSANDAARRAVSAIYPNLAGKRVVITGGGSGIGAGLVETSPAKSPRSFLWPAGTRSAELIARLADAPIQQSFYRTGENHVTVGGYLI